MRVRKRPVQVEAWLYEPRYNSGEEVRELLGTYEGWSYIDGELRIATLEGTMKVSPGDWIIRGVNGELYPCKPDIFEKTYEQVEPWDE